MPIMPMYPCPPPAMYYSAQPAYPAQPLSPQQMQDNENYQHLTHGSMDVIANDQPAARETRQIQNYPGPIPAMPIRIIIKRQREQSVSPCQASTSVGSRYEIEPSQHSSLLREIERRAISPDSQSSEDEQPAVHPRRTLVASPVNVRVNQQNSVPLTSSRSTNTVTSGLLASSACSAVQSNSRRALHQVGAIQTRESSSNGASNGRNLQRSSAPLSLSVANRPVAVVGVRSVVIAPPRSPEVEQYESASSEVHSEETDSAIDTSGYEGSIGLRSESEGLDEDEESLADAPLTAYDRTPPESPRSFNPICIVCNDHKVHSAFVPCGHFCFCQICYD